MTNTLRIALVTASAGCVIAFFSYAPTADADSIPASEYVANGDGIIDLIERKLSC